MRIVMESISKRFGTVTALRGIDLEVHDGEFLVLLGPSGCGKTTTMRAIAGLEQPDTGRISIGERAVFDARSGVNVPPHSRDVGMVFQSYAIWPHMTVERNVAYPLRRKRYGRSAIQQRVQQMLELIGLGDLGKRPASDLSGGQMQRVALARSLAMEPKVLLMDEPLSNLDARLRDKLRFELRSLQQQLALTTVYVTHDQAEALALADRIAVMADGDFVQLGTPTDVYLHPVDAFVAEFMGVDNILPVAAVKSHGGLVEFQLGDGTWLRAATRGTGVADGATGTGDDAVLACVRGQDVELRPQGDAAAGDGANVLRGRVDVASFMGDHAAYQVALASGTKLHVRMGQTRTPLGTGTAVDAVIKPDDVQVLPGASRPAVAP